MRISFQAVNRNDWLFPMLILVVFVAVLWIPFGLKRPDRMEGWVLMNDLEQKDSPISPNLDGSGRPLVLLPWFIAHWLDANSFLGVHLLMIALLSGKGFLLYRLLQHLFPKKSLYALLAAALSIVYPSDTGVVDTRILNLHMAILMYLLAVYLVVRQKDFKQPFWGLASAVIAEVVSLAIYEIAYPLVIMTPVFLWWIQKRLTRRLIFTSALWFTGPLLYSLYWLHISKLSNGVLPDYQQRFLSGGIDSANIVQNILNGIVYAYRQNLWSGWITATQQINTQYLGWAIAAVFLIAGLICLLKRQSPTQTHLLSLSLIGLFILFLGYFPYSLTSLRFETWRVFLYASIGAALTVTALAEGVASRFRAGKLVFIGLMAPLLTVGIVAAFNEQQTFTNNSSAQERVLVALAKQAPKIAPGTLVLMLDDPSDWGAIQTFWTNFYFESSIRYLYAEQAIQARICYPFLGAWGEWQDYCQLGDQQVIVGGGGFDHKVVKTYDKILAFRYSPTKGATLLWQIPSLYQSGRSHSPYNPRNVVDFSSPMPYRISTLFMEWPMTMASSNIEPIVDGETIGLGRNWYLPESDGHQTFQWVNNDAEFSVSAQPEPTITLRIEIGPGPGMNYHPFRLDVLNNNHIIATVNVQTQQMVTLILPINAGQAPTFSLHAEGGGLTTPDDSRILNFRVFHMSLLSFF